jgi:hypothetical protein
MENGMDSMECSEETSANESSEEGGECIRPAVNRIVPSIPREEEETPIETSTLQERAQFLGFYDLGPVVQLGKIDRTTFYRSVKFSRKDGADPRVAIARKYTVAVGDIVCYHSSFLSLF